MAQEALLQQQEEALLQQQEEALLQQQRTKKDKNRNKNKNKDRVLVDNGQPFESEDNLDSFGELEGEAGRSSAASSSSSSSSLSSISTKILKAEGKETDSRETQTRMNSDPTLDNNRYESKTVARQEGRTPIKQHLQAFCNQLPPFNVNENAAKAFTLASAAALALEAYGLLTHNLPMVSLTGLYATLVMTVTGGFLAFVVARLKEYRWKKNLYTSSFPPNVDEGWSIITAGLGLGFAVVSLVVAEKFILGQQSLHTLLHGSTPFHVALLVLGTCVLTTALFMKALDAVVQSAWNNRKSKESSTSKEPSTSEKVTRGFGTFFKVATPFTLITAVGMGCAAIDSANHLKLIVAACLLAAGFAGHLLSDAFDDEANKSTLKRFGPAVLGTAGVTSGVAAGVLAYRDSTHLNQLASAMNPAQVLLLGAVFCLAAAVGYLINWRAEAQEKGAKEPTGYEALHGGNTTRGEWDSDHLVSAIPTTSTSFGGGTPQ